MREALALELRVLSGCHAGACAVARDGMLIGAGEDAEVILTDLHSGAKLARLHLLEGERWLLAPVDVDPDDSARTQALNIGEPCHWGGLALCVSGPCTDWPPVPPAISEPTIDMTSEAASMMEAVEAEEAAGAESLVSMSDTGDASVQGGQRGRSWALWGGAFLSLMLFLLAALAWGRLQVSSESGVGPTSPPEIDLTAQAHRQVPDLAVAVAQVDSALRMQLTPQRDGRVQVNGWVESVAQFDRLADVLGTRRPPPQMRVFVVSDVRAELKAQLADSYPQLDFYPGGPGSLRMSGIVLTEAEKAEVLAAVLPLMPAGIELKAELRLAEKLVPDVQSALKAGGFDNVHVHWDGNQIVVALSLTHRDRDRLENSLVALNGRFPGLPLRVMPELVTPTIQTARASSPFPIRGIIGGDVPYLVLPGGGKLLPGGTHAGWRLQSIEPEVLIFDTPRRLVVAR